MRNYIIISEFSGSTDFMVVCSHNIKEKKCSYYWTKEIRRASLLPRSVALKINKFLGNAFKVMSENSMMVKSMMES